MDRESPVAGLLPRQASLDPLTGLVDRRWFGIALANTRRPPPHDGRDFAVIAARLEVMTLPDDEGGLAIRDGRLLLAAEVIQSVIGKHDLTARVGHNMFAVLAHGHPAEIVKVADAMCAALLCAGISARVAWAVGGAHGALFAALRSAERQVRSSDFRACLGENAPSLVEVVAVDAAVATSLRDDAIDVLMKWHGSTPKRARRQLARQAHELGLSLTAMARLLVVVSTGRLTGAPVARGIELERTARLPRHTSPSQPRWTFEPPNAASARMTLGQPHASSGLCDLRLAGRYQAAGSRRGSGGDWFDGFVLPNGTVALVLGDVSGHDTLAATVMMQLRTMVRNIAGRSEAPPSEVLRQLDRSLIKLGCDRVATVVFCWLRTDSAGRVELRWCNAGHLAPALVTSDGAANVLDSADDLLLGLDGDAERSDLTITLPTGATVLLFSDGLIETRTSDIDDGLARLCVAAGPLGDAGVTTLRDVLLRRMVSPDTPDDVTLLVARVSRAEEMALVGDQGMRASAGREQRWR
ncbi:MAG TPA: SpoIIE family protein phosphatase [Acidothermaceae bacterium]|jgi:GGDEF domain-containing protein